MSNSLIEDQELEILTILTEECSEVIKESCKIVRFGNDYDKLERELGDLTCMIALLAEHGYIDYEKMEVHAKEKLAKLKKYSNLEIND